MVSKQNIRPAGTRQDSWEPFCRLIRQPIRSSADKARDALTEGHFRGNSRSNEGNLQFARRSFAVFQAIRNQPQRQSFRCGQGLLLGSSVSGHSGQSRNVGQPAAIVLAVKLYLKGESRSGGSPRHALIMAQTAETVNCALAAFPMPRRLLGGD